MDKYLHRYSWDSPCENDTEVRQVYQERRKKSAQKAQSVENNKLLRKWRRER